MSNLDHALQYTLNTVHFLYTLHTSHTLHTLHTLHYLHTLRSKWNTAVLLRKISVQQCTTVQYISLHSVQGVSLSCSVAVYSSLAVRGRVWQCSSVALYGSVAGGGGWAM